MLILWKQRRRDKHTVRAHHLIRMLVILAGIGLGSRAYSTPELLSEVPARWTSEISDAGWTVTPAPSTASEVSVLVLPLTPLSGDLDSYFAEDVPGMIEDLFGETIGQSAPRPMAPTDTAGPGRAYSHLVKGNDGRELHLEVVAYPVGTNVQLTIIASPKDLAADDPFLREASSFVARLKQKQLALGTSAADKTTTGTNAAAPLATGSLSPPDNPDAHVENVIQYLGMSFDGTGATSDPSAPTTALLFDDGRVFRKETRAPSVFDPGTRPPGSEGVGRWEKDGEGYSIVWDDGAGGTAVSNAAKTFPAPASMSLDGRYVAAGASSSASLPGALTFHDDQSVMLDRAAATGSPGDLTSARYRISQRTIELLNADGSSAAHLFGFQGDQKKPDLLVIGDRLYERQE